MSRYRHQGKARVEAVRASLPMLEERLREQLRGACDTAAQIVDQRLAKTKPKRRAVGPRPVQPGANISSLDAPKDVGGGA